jgi:gluconolactonase
MEPAFDGCAVASVAHASLGSVFVLSPKGEPLARIRSYCGAMTTNLALGGPDAGRAFITASESGAVLASEWPPEGATADAA